MSNDKDVARLYKLQATVGKLVLDQKRDAKAVADVLQSIIDPSAPQHVIDCDAAPNTRMWSAMECRVVSHQRVGQLAWDPTRFKLWLPEEQRDWRDISVPDLRSVLASKTVLNANVLDHLLKYQHLIPPVCRVPMRDGSIGMYALFWGTIYANKDGEFVRSLMWTGRKSPGMDMGKWGEYPVYFDRDFFSCNYPAAIFE